jgi:soluble lytic murein transglycosylase
MFQALGSPKGALFGVSAAALILAITYSISAVPMRGIEVVRVAPQPLALPVPVADVAQPVVEVASFDDVDPVVTGSITTTSWAKVPQRAMATPTSGSSGFIEALGLIEDKKYADAYASASGLTDNVERRTIQWAAITYGGSSIAPATIKRFEDDAPDFVDADTFKTRLEQALVKSQASPDDFIKYLGGAMPATLDGQIKLAAAYVADGQTKRGAAIARSIWVEQFLDKTTEERMLTNFADLLTPADHWARAMHLMMHDRATGAERLYKFLTPAQKSLAVARNAVSRDAKNAKALLDEVDPSMQTNPLYYFSRAQRARQFELWDDAIAYLNKGKASDPDSAEWWYERQSLTRQLLSKGDPKRAYQAAAGYIEGPDGRVVEAQFHAGWIALSFLDDAKRAAAHFAKQAEHSTLPDTVTQANYWLGRALTKAGEAEAATAAFKVAAGYPTVYYGLLARQELGLKPVELRAMPEWKDSEAAFNGNEVVKAINLLVADGETEKAGALLKTLAQQLQTGGELVLAARLAQTIDAHNLAISIADIADKRGMPLDLFSFPKDGLPANKVAAADTAAIYAIARQESRFQVNAVSSAGARGLMQLMPGTAKEVASKIGLAYSATKLTTDPLYNAQLGASYLDRQLDKYGGSLLLAAAAYNAGPGNANKWITAFGDPRSSKVDPVVWVELIPFQETRKYVQRVFGNYMVYRARLGYDDTDLSKVMHSING